MQLIITFKSSANLTIALMFYTNQNVIKLGCPHVVTGHKEKKPLILVPGHYKLK
jgi:hypothetical protein